MYCTMNWAKHSPYPQGDNILVEMTSRKQVINALVYSRARTVVVECTK